MPHPVVHAEIRSNNPDATREFYGELFGWTFSAGAFPGYTFADVGLEGALPTAIGPLQGGEGAQEVPGVTFGVFADAQGHLVGVAAS